MEDELIRQLAKILPRSADTIVGIGDDCAVTRPPNQKELLLLKTDCVVEGIHFEKNAPPTWVGWKALCRAISDIAACGGTPVHAMITLVIPPRISLNWLKSAYRGLAKAARQFHIGIVGGETSRSLDSLFLSVALIGRVSRKHLVLRSCAQPGDSLFVTGCLGGALRKDRHLKFMPRLVEAQWLTTHFPIHSMIDISDGIGSDLPRMAQASKTGFEIQPDLLPRTPGCSIQQAISDGEDYELLFAISPRQENALIKQWPFRKLKLTKIGRMTDNPRQNTPLPHGYDHFRGEH